MKKIKIFADKNKKSQKIKRAIEKKIKSIENNHPNLNIVIGGDGFMLQIIKKKYKPSNTFYGINSGNYGFLMNRFSKKFFLKNLKNANIIKISPLEMIVKTNNTIKKFLAVNEVSILRQSRQAAYLSIKYKNNFIIKNLISDGVLVSTPAGSTAYNLSVYGPILNLNQNLRLRFKRGLLIGFIREFLLNFSYYKDFKFFNYLLQSLLNIFLFLRYLPFTIIKTLFSFKK